MISHWGHSLCKKDRCVILEFESVGANMKLTDTKKCFQLSLSVL